MSWKFLALAVGLGSSLGAGCAFKGSEPAPTSNDGVVPPVVVQGPAAEVATSPFDGSLFEVLVGWENRSDWISLPSATFQRREKWTWANGEPVSIPSVVPDTVKIGAVFNEDAQKFGSVRMAARLLEGDTGVGRELGFSDLAVAARDGRAMVEIRLHGMRELLRDDQEQRILLSLEYQTDQGARIVLLTLATPPSTLIEKQRESYSAIQGGGRESTLPLF